MSDVNVTIDGDITIRTKRVLNPDGCFGGRASVDANVPPLTCVKENDIVITAKQFEQHPDILKKLIIMCTNHELERVLYNTGDNVTVLYP